MVLMDKNTAAPGVFLQGVGRGRRQRVLAESIKKGEDILFLLPLCKLQQLLAHSRQ
jgi:hypothetical protein